MGSNLEELGDTFTKANIQEECMPQELTDKTNTTLMGGSSSDLSSKSLNALNQPMKENAFSIPDVDKSLPGTGSNGSGSSTSVNRPCGSEMPTDKEGPQETPNDPDPEADLSDEEDVAEAPGGGDTTFTSIDARVGQKKKPKKKKKPKSQRGLNKPTGFEEYYVDAPVTPAEHEQEQGLYNMSRPFAQRIETAIQRFVSKRNLDPTRKNLFDKYLKHGGISSGPKMFTGGLDDTLLESRNAQDIAAMAATHFLDFDESDPRSEIYIVDFEGCVKAFFSSYLHESFELPNQEVIHQLVGVIRNFLNYLIHHDVCPEYRDQVDASRRACDLAEKELWGITRAERLLPGDFNSACSELFGGCFQGIYTANQAWTIGEDSETSVGISPERAQEIFRFGLATHATDKMFALYESQMKDKTLRVIDTEDACLEITSIILGEHYPETRALNGTDGRKNPKNLGMLHAKTWLGVTPIVGDLTEDEEAELTRKPRIIKEYEFWVENEVLHVCFEGMKLRTVVRELSCGLCFFDALFGIHCSFYDVLPNQKIMGWRELEKEWLPPRSESLEMGAGDENDSMKSDDETVTGDSIL